MSSCHCLGCCSVRVSLKRRGEQLQKPSAEAQETLLGAHHKSLRSSRLSSSVKGRDAKQSTARKRRQNGEKREKSHLLYLLFNVCGMRESASFVGAPYCPPLTKSGNPFLCLFLPFWAIYSLGVLFIPSSAKSSSGNSVDSQSNSPRIFRSSS